MKDSAISALKRVCAAAREDASGVDAQARFPNEAFSRIRETGLLSHSVPLELGGHGGSMSDSAEVCFQLGRSCGSSAVIFAMHEIQVASLKWAAGQSDCCSGFLEKLCREQWLVASSTSEFSSGLVTEQGDAAHGRLRYAKSGASISYLQQADAVLFLADTAEPGADARRRGLALVYRGQYLANETSHWSGLGVRGTCTHTYDIRVDVPRSQVLDFPFELINAQVMLPVAHILLTSAWAGITSAALESAQQVAVRRKNPAFDSVLMESIGLFYAVRGAIRGAEDEYRKVLADDGACPHSPSFDRRMLLLKATCSDLMVTIANNCLRVAGFSGYQDDSSVSVSRQLRDVLSAPLMIPNISILSTSGELVEEPLEASLFQNATER